MFYRRSDEERPSYGLRPTGYSAFSWSRTLRMGTDNFFNWTFHTLPFGAVEQAPPSASVLEEKISDSLQRPYPTDKNPLPQLYVKWASK
jgi:hypothetical protein